MPELKPHNIQATVEPLKRRLTKENLRNPTAPGRSARNGAADVEHAGVYDAVPPTLQFAEAICAKRLFKRPQSVVGEAPGTGTVFQNGELAVHAVDATGDDATVDRNAQTGRAHFVDPLFQFVVEQSHRADVC